MLIQANHKQYKWSLLLYKYILTVKLAYGLYHDAPVVDYNLFIKFFDIGDVKYPPHARLHKDWNSQVSGNMRQVLTSNKHI